MKMDSILHKLLICRTPGWVVAEAALLLTAAAALLMSLAQQLPDRAASQGFELMALPAAGLLAALRLRVHPGTRPLQAAEELTLAATLSIIGYLVWNALLVWLVESGYESSRLLELLEYPYRYLVLASSGGVFLALRAGLRLWKGWKRLRRRHLAFALTHTYLSTMAAAAMAVVVVFAFVQAYSLPLPQAPSSQGASNWIGEAAALIVFGFVPPFHFNLALAVLLLAVAAPFVALTSLWIARHTTSRLSHLDACLSRLSTGDLEARVEVEGQDEVARLQKAFNQTADRLKQTLHELQQEKQRSQRLLESRRRLFADVSHDLKTPVAVIRAWSENAKDDPTGDTAEALAVIESEARHLQGLIQDILSLARGEEDGVDVECRPVDLLALARERVQHLSRLARSRQVHLSLHSGGPVEESVQDEETATEKIQADPAKSGASGRPARPKPSPPKQNSLSGKTTQPPPRDSSKNNGPGSGGMAGTGSQSPVLAWCDPARTDQILCNLLENAIRHTPQGGIVQVDVSHQEDRAVLSVRDTGPGIPPEQLETLLQRRRQGDNPGKAGLGLSVCRSLALSMGGSLRVLSLTPSGLGVSLSLPLTSPGQPLEGS
ncbi:MAG TPA: ATP-binding protein [Acidobacteriota bacterium]|nr:ATP-binding protein [Acidobacteriota bacterium]